MYRAMIFEFSLVFNSYNNIVYVLIVAVYIIQYNYDDFYCFAFKLLYIYVLCSVLKKLCMNCFLNMVKLLKSRFQPKKVKGVAT